MAELPNPKLVAAVARIQTLEGHLLNVIASVRALENARENQLDSTREIEHAKFSINDALDILKLETGLYAQQSAADAQAVVGVGTARR